MALGVARLAIGKQSLLRRRRDGQHAEKADQEHDQHQQAVLQQMFAPFAQQAVSRSMEAGNKGNRVAFAPPTSSGRANAP